MLFLLLLTMTGTIALLVSQRGPPARRHIKHSSLMHHGATGSMLHLEV